MFNALFSLALAKKDGEKQTLLYSLLSLLSPRTCSLVPAINSSLQLQP